MKKGYFPNVTSERIKELSKKRAVPLSQLNEICELSKNTIAQSGRGTDGMKAKNLFMIAEALECSVDYLLGRTDSPEPQYSNSVKIGSIGDNSNNNSNNMQINRSEDETEISSILSELNKRERTELMMIIYKFYDEHKKEQ